MFLWQVCCAFSIIIPQQRTWGTEAAPAHAARARATAAHTPAVSEVDDAGDRHRNSGLPGGGFAASPAL